MAPDNLSSSNVNPQQWLNFIQNKAEKGKNSKNSAVNLGNLNTGFKSEIPEAYKKMNIKKIYEISESVINELPTSNIKTNAYAQSKTNAQYSDRSEKKETALQIKHVMSQLIDQKSESVNKTIKLTNSVWLNGLKYVAVATLFLMPVAALIQIGQSITKKIAKDEIKELNKLRDALWQDDTEIKVDTNLKPPDTSPKNEKKVDSPPSLDEQEDVANMLGFEDLDLEKEENIENPEEITLLWKKAEGDDWEGNGQEISLDNSEESFGDLSKEESSDGLSIKDPEEDENLDVDEKPKLN